MEKQIRALQYIDYVNNFEIVANYLKGTSIDKNEVISCLNKIAFYTNKLEMQESSTEVLYKELRHDKIRAINRARLAEKKVEELEKQLKKYKLKEKLGF